MPSDSDDRSRRLPAGRKARLAAYVAEAGQVTVGELAERFGVSIDTVRRDLDQLSAEGTLVRTYGGAVSQGSNQARVDRAVDVRMTIATPEKEKIAALAATLVHDGGTIMINGGTTTLAVAQQLRNHRSLTVATNNLLIPPVLPESAVQNLYVFGGAVRTLTQATVGPVSFAVAGGVDLDISCDLALIGVGAVAATGYSTSNLAEAAMMREMIARAARVAILADSTKFGRRLFAQICGLASADYLITDSPPPAELQDELADADVELLTPEGSAPGS